MATDKHLSTHKILIGNEASYDETSISAESFIVNAEGGFVVEAGSTGRIRSEGVLTITSGSGSGIEIDTSGYIQISSSNAIYIVPDVSVDIDSGSVLGAIDDTGAIEWTKDLDINSANIDTINATSVTISGQSSAGNGLNLTHSTHPLPVLQGAESSDEGYLSIRTFSAIDFMTDNDDFDIHFGIGYDDGSSSNWGGWARHPSVSSENNAYLAKDITNCFASAAHSADGWYLELLGVIMQQSTTTGDTGTTNEASNATIKVTLLKQDGTFSGWDVLGNWYFYNASISDSIDLEYLDLSSISEEDRMISLNDSLILRVAMYNIVDDSVIKRDSALFHGIKLWGRERYLHP